MAGSRQVALIRGINVGRAKRVAMADLRSLVTRLGYGDVRTLLNSGNLVFTAPRSVQGDPASRIEKAMAARLGVSARVIVLSAAELAAIVAENPLRRIADNPSLLLVAFLGKPSDRSRLVPLTRQDWSPEALAMGKRAAYLWCPEGASTGRLFEAIHRGLGDAATTRNWATTLKLHAMATEEAV